MSTFIMDFLCNLLLYHFPPRDVDREHVGRCGLGAEGGPCGDDRLCCAAEAGLHGVHGVPCGVRGVSARRAQSPGRGWGVVLQLALALWNRSAHFLWEQCGFAVDTG